MGKDLEKHITGTPVLEDKLQPGHRVRTRMTHRPPGTWAARRPRKGPAASHSWPPMPGQAYRPALAGHISDRADNPARPPRTSGAYSAEPGLRKNMG
jgi:hypothetical protein